MSRRGRIVLAVVVLVTVVLAVVLPAARADVFGNVAPASQLPSGALADAYPLSRYGLDHHFDAVKAGVLSGVDVSGIAPTIAWLLASIVWQITALLASVVITLFSFAFSLDLVNGSEATGGNGALAPVSDAVTAIYRDVFGAPWMTVAVLIAGLWAIWNALVRRRYTETAGALGMSVLFVTIALAFVTQPERTIGTASRWTNEISGAFLSLSANGTVTDHAEAKRQVGDQLFKTLVYDPWVVLNFGGLEHCVRHAGGDDPVSVPVRPFSTSAGRDAQLARELRRGQQIETDNGKVCVNNATKYAPHFLRFELDSDERNAEYEALKDGDSGKLPDEDPGKRDGTYRLGPVDAPAAEAMGKGGQYERLGLALVIFLGELGAFVLLGSLSVAVIVAQVLVLLLLAFAPVALVAAVIPRRGHEFFTGWLQRLVTFLIRKALYSLILAVLLAVAAALANATGNLGWLMAFGLQAVFFWAVFLYRRQLTGQLSTAVTGSSGGRDESRVTGAGLLALYAGGRVLRRALRREGPPRHSTASHDAPPRPERPDTEQPAPPAAPAPLQDAEEGTRATESPRSPRPDSAAARRNERPAEQPDVRREDAPPDSATAPPPRPAPAERRAGSVRGESRRGHPLDDARAEAHTTSAAPSSEPPRRGGAADTLQAPDALEQSSRRVGAAPAAEGRQVARRQEPSGESARQENPLLASLRHDARRLHRDANRLHQDAQQFVEHEQPSTTPARRSAQRSTPLPPPPAGRDADRGDRS